MYYLQFEELHNCGLWPHMYYLRFGESQDCGFAAYVLICDSKNRFKAVYGRKLKTAIEDRKFDSFGVIESICDRRSLL